MINLYSLLKSYIITSILWFVFMLNIIIIRLINNENVNDVFGVSLLDTTLCIFAVITVSFLFVVLHSNKVYFSNGKMFFI